MSKKRRAQNNKKRLKGCAPEPTYVTIFGVHPAYRVHKTRLTKAQATALSTEKIKYLTLDYT